MASLTPGAIWANPRSLRSIVICLIILNVIGALFLYHSNRRDGVSFPSYVSCGKPSLACLQRTARY
jgi:hypothetical protein